MRRLIPIIPIACLAAACGAASHGSSPPPQSTPKASLAVVIQPGLIANAHTQHYRLTCSPAGGNLPHPAAACAALAESPHLLDPLPGCDKVIPDTGSKTITGSFAGRAVHLRFSCPAGTRRWGRLAPVLGLAQKAFG
jgi:hypothetical protein